jgi:glycerol-3-phosphate dehydrogenase
MDYLKAEAVYAVTHEGALHIEDVLRRRLRASMEEWDQGAAAAPEVAALIAPHLDWDAETVKRETEHYLRQVEAERDARRQVDDVAAAAVLGKVPALFSGRAAS